MTALVSAGAITRTEQVSKSALADKTGPDLFAAAGIPPAPPATRPSVQPHIMTANAANKAVLKILMDDMAQVYLRAARLLCDITAAGRIRNAAGL
ncbi:MAG: hypothetical protein WC299_04865 [Kiritimatiellia bacterium]